jgi:hypothetical protein
MHPHASRYDDMIGYYEFSIVGNRIFDLVVIFVPSSSVVFGSGFRSFESWSDGRRCTVMSARQYVRPTCGKL